MIVRALAREDADALAVIHAAAFEAPWSGEEILGFAEDRGGFAIGAEAADGRLEGFILWRIIAGEAEVLTLAVLPNRRRQGVGSALLQAAMAAAAPMAEAMFLEVAEDNPGALALYLAAGFEPVGRRAGYYGRADRQAVDALVMRRALNT